MNNKFSKIFLLLAIFFTVPSLTKAATPTIISVAGEVTSGQILIITGTNMVQEDKTNWMNLDVYSWKNPNFKSTEYGFEGISDSDDGFCAAGNCDGNYDSATKLMGGKSIKFNVSGISCWGSCSGGNYLSDNNSFYSPAVAYYFRSYYRFHNFGNGWPTEDMKMFIQQNSGSNTYWQLGMNGGLDPNSFLQFSQIGGTTTSTSYSSPTLFDVWYEMEGYYNPSTHIMQLWLNGVYQGQRSMDAATPQYFVFGMPTVWNSTSGFNLDANFDNLSISSSRIYPSSLIEISGDDGLTWRAQNFVNVGSNSALSEIVATFKADLPTKTAANYLLRVTNNQQQTSATYILSGSADTTAPSAPTGLGIM